MTANLALSAMGARAKSWEKGSERIPGYEPWRVNDGYLGTYWIGRMEKMPVDIGIEWHEPRSISAVAARYLDSRLVPDYVESRLYQFGRIQYWDDGTWRDVEAEITGLGTAVNWYTFRPVSTTRVRLLYNTRFVHTGRTSEMGSDMEVSLPPPIPPGVYVCQLEAYEKAPFTQAGLTIIEPEPTRLFEDSVRPTSIPEESAWAESECEAATDGANICLKNGFIALNLKAGPGLTEVKLANLVTKEQVVPSDGKAFHLLIGDRDLFPSDFEVCDVHISNDPPREESEIRVELVRGDIEVSVHYRLRRIDHFYHKWLVVKNRSDSVIVLKDVTLSMQGLPDILGLPSPEELSYPMCCLERGGFFACIEFPYWEAREDSLLYYPGASIDPGTEFVSERAVVGVYENRGEIMMGFDIGVRDWVTAYHARVSPLHSSWPERYHEGWCANHYVSYADSDPDRVERIMATAERLGITYADGYEDTKAAMLISEDTVDRWIEAGKRHGVGLGTFVDHGGDGGLAKPAGMAIRPFRCKLSPECKDYFDRVVAFAGRHGYGCLHHDFFFVYPCNDSGHGHLPGKYSLYPQAREFLDFDRRIHEACPGIMTSGDGTFASAQWARLFDGRLHGILNWDHYPVAQPDLHLDRLYAEYGHGYMMAGHYAFLRPWFRMLNCVSHWGKVTHKHDGVGFRYNVLSAIAVAPQVCFQEIPDNIPDADVEFTDRWLSWAAENRDYFRYGDKLFCRHFAFNDLRHNPSEALEGFSHIRKDRGFLFLINASPAEQVAALTLDLHVSEGTRFEVADLYPGRFRLAGPREGSYANGDVLQVTVPARHIRALWVGPAGGAYGELPLKREDHDAAGMRRLITDWKVVREDKKGITLSSEFHLPRETLPATRALISHGLWEAEPWAYAKAYLVLILKNNLGHVRNVWIQDNLEIGMNVNGKGKRVVPIRTCRPGHFPADLCRGYFTDLSLEARAGEQNSLEITLPRFKQGIVFGGVYVDLPDQMPPMLPPEA